MRRVYGWFTRPPVWPAAAFFLISVAFVASPLSAKESVSMTCEEGEALRVAQAVQSHYESIQTLGASFEQRTESVVMGMSALSDLADAEVSRGRVLLGKPGLMRWTYTEPQPSLVVSDGRTLWVYDALARQVTRVPVGQQVLAGAALQFLLGEGSLLETFQIEASSCTPSSVVLDLQPIAPASYERLGLVADPKSGVIFETSIVDLFGNRTRIRFSDLITNQPIAPEQFEFVVPNGVEVNDLGF